MDKVTLINPADYTPDGDPLLHLLAACVRFRLIALIMTSVLMKDLITPNIYFFLSIPENNEKKLTVYH